MPEGRRDLAPSQTACEAVIAATTADAPAAAAPGPVGATVALRPQKSELADHEQACSTEWLDGTADSRATAPACSARSG